jgi:hypothetical protein
MQKMLLHNNFGTNGKTSYDVDGGLSVNYTGMAVYNDKIYLSGYGLSDKLNNFIIAAVDNSSALPFTLLNFSAQRKCYKIGFVIVPELILSAQSFLLLI